MRLDRTSEVTPSRRRRRQFETGHMLGSCIALPEVIELREPPRQSFRRAAKSLRLFGRPPQVRETPDGRALGGPAASPSEWLWAVYAGPSTERRRQALGLVDARVLSAWRERAQGTAGGFLGVRTLAGYHLVAQDADGPYLIGYSWLFGFNPLPFQSPNFVYRQLLRGVRWLGQGSPATGDGTT